MLFPHSRRNFAENKEPLNAFRDIEALLRVNIFTAHFNAGNVFGFKTDCHGDEQCRAFADSLAEFIDNDTGWVEKSQRGL